MSGAVQDSAPVVAARKGAGTTQGRLLLGLGLAMLAASLVAGLLWDRLGAPATFLAGAGFALFAAALIAARPFSAVSRRA